MSMLPPPGSPRSPSTRGTLDAQPAVTAARRAGWRGVARDVARKPIASVVTALIIAASWVLRRRR